MGFVYVVGFLSVRVLPLVPDLLMEFINGTCWC